MFDVIDGRVLPPMMKTEIRQQNIDFLCENKFE